MLSALDTALARLPRPTPAFTDIAAPVQLGRIVSCDGLLVEATGLEVPIGTICRAVGTRGAHQPAAEVVGFRAGHSLMMLLGDTVQLQPGTMMRPEGQPGMVPVGDAFLGRAIDGSGQPIDGGSAIRAIQYRPLGGIRDAALERASVIEPFDTGIRPINALLTMGVGQRIGIIAGSGVGKSKLVDMLMQGSDADVLVIGLIGERGREVSDFVARHLHDEARRKRTAVVAVPADHAANLRLRGAQHCVALAEHFRAQGKRVMLVIDSLTRIAHAAREIAFTLGESGAARGYPASALGTITKLIERAGISASSGGAITGIYTVLADGDDQNDPVVDTARAILDGHIVLSRDIAQRGQFPAIDVPASLSRVMDDVTDPQHHALARELRALIAAHEANRDLLMMGAYSPGSDPQLDRAIAMQGAIRDFLTQDLNETAPFAASRAALAALLGDSDGEARS